MELSSRKPSDMERVIFNVLTAVERLFANSGVRQGAQPREVGHVACGRSVLDSGALLLAKIRKLRRASSR